MFRRRFIINLSMKYDNQCVRIKMLFKNEEKKEEVKRYIYGKIQEEF